jgi:hypothetical protein
MSSHHDHDNHSTEPKTVAFRTPLIMGLVTILIILLAVSTCDNKHDEHDTHSSEHATEAHGAEHATEAHEASPAEEHAAVADTTVTEVNDTTAAPAKVEEHAHH